MSGKSKEQLTVKTGMKKSKSDFSTCIKELNLTLSTEYKIRFSFSIIFFIFSVLIFWAIGSYGGWLPNFGLATRLYRSIGESLSESMGAIGAYNLLLLLSLIGFINGLTVLIAVVYRNFKKKK